MMIHCLVIEKISSRWNSVCDKLSRRIKVRLYRTRTTGVLFADIFGYYRSLERIHHKTKSRQDARWQRVNSSWPFYFEVRMLLKLLKCSRSLCLSVSLLEKIFIFNVAFENLRGSPRFAQQKCRRSLFC